LAFVGIARGPVSPPVVRFPRSLRNLLLLFAEPVDQTRCFMNSGPQPELIFQQAGPRVSYSILVGWRIWSRRPVDDPFKDNLW
jgi:hypothetical protein